MSPIKKIINEIINESEGTNGFILLSQIGLQLQRRGISIKDCGYNRLIDFFKSYPDDYEILWTTIHTNHHPSIRINSTEIPDLPESGSDTTMEPPTLTPSTNDRPWNTEDYEDFDLVGNNPNNYENNRDTIKNTYEIPDPPESGSDTTIELPIQTPPLEYYRAKLEAKYKNHPNASSIDITYVSEILSKIDTPPRVDLGIVFNQNYIRLEILGYRDIALCTFDFTNQTLRLIFHIESDSYNDLFNDHAFDRDRRMSRITYAQNSNYDNRYFEIDRVRPYGRSFRIATDKKYIINNVIILYEYKNQ